MASSAAVMVVQARANQLPNSDSTKNRRVLPPLAGGLAAGGAAAGLGGAAGAGLGVTAVGGFGGGLGVPLMFVLASDMTSLFAPKSVIGRDQATAHGKCCTAGRSLVNRR